MIAEVHATPPPTRPYPLPADEAGRLAALERYSALGKLPEEPFSGLARTAALALRAPIALVTLVGTRYQHVKGVAGTEGGSTPRELSLCAHTICGAEPLVIEDAARDERFAANPLVVAQPGIRAYAGVPLRTPDGHSIGTVCVVDTEPRAFADDELEALRALAAAAMDALALRSDARAHKRVAAEYRALFRAHPQPMLVFDTDSLRILTANEAALETYGYTREEIRGLTIRDLRPPDQLPALHRRLAQLEGRRASAGPWLHRRKDGSTFHVNVESMPTTFAGRAARIVRITDATEVVSAREAQGHSEAVAEGALAAIDDIFFVADVEGRLVRWNRKAVGVSGYSEADLAGMRVLDFFAGADRERVAEAFAEALFEGGLRVEADLLAKDGRRSPYEFTGSILRDAGGEVTGVCGIGRDMTGWKEAEALRAGELAVLRAVATGVPLAEALALIARLLEAQLPGSLCSILLHDPDAGVLRHGAAPSLPDAYNAAVDGLAVGPMAGSCGSATYLDRPVLVEDIATDPRWAGLRALALPHGLRACWSTPIHARSGEVLGTFGVYYREPRGASAGATVLIDHIVHLAAVAIEHDRTARQLLRRDQLLRGTAEAMHALVAEPSFDAASGRALRALGEAAGVDRVYHFEYHADPETGALLASQRAEWAREGVTPELENPELQGLSMAEVLPEWDAALRKGDPVLGRIRELSRAGRALLEAQGIVSLLLIPVKEDGEVRGFVGFDDCTREREWCEAERATLTAAAAALGKAQGRARAEAALREANARYEAVAENAPGIVFQCTYEPDGTLAFPYISGGGGTSLGTDLTVLQNEPWRIVEIIHPEDWEGYRASVLEAATSLEPWCWEGRVVAADGGVRWASGAAKLVPTEDGRMLWHGLFLDATARRAAEAALREHEAQFRQMAESMPQIVWTTTPDGRPNYVNSRWYEYSGMPRVPGAPLSVAEYIHPDDSPRNSAEWTRCVETGEGFEIEIRLRRGADDTYRWFIVRAEPVRDAEGAIVQWFGTSTDVHDLREARQAAEEAQRAAEEAARLKSALLTNMSHELRTPLTGIIGFSDLLQHEAAEEQREMARHISLSGRRLLGTLNSVLAFAELESGRHHLEIVTVPLGALAQETTARLRSYAQKKGLALEHEPSVGEALVRADTAALRQIVMNLVSNAIKFTEAGSVTVSVREVGGWGELRVADTGVGIAEEFLPRLFREFAQESEGLTRRYEGSGLGLAVTKRLVLALGGTLEVESEKGRGSTFTVRLPLA